MKRLLFGLVVGAMALHAQSAQTEGLWQGYDGEWGHVSRQVIALAEATPAEAFTWRPVPGVRSMSEVYMHIAIDNFWLLSVTGVKMTIRSSVERAGKDGHIESRSYLLAQAVVRSRPGCASCSQACRSGAESKGWED
jgi:hypothetical protein